MGNYNFKDETENIYGRLRVLERVENSPSGRIQWICQCECGNIHTVLGNSLRNGGTKSCGCLNDEVRAGCAAKATDAWRLPDGVAAFRIALRVYKHNATDRNFLWDLSDNEAFDFMRQNCFYCDAVPATIAGNERTNGIFLYNGLDRVNNEEGYYPENVVSCCNECNLAKGKRSVENFIKWAHRVSKHTKPGSAA